MITQKVTIKTISESDFASLKRTIS